MSHGACHMSNLQNFITPKPLELVTWNFEAIFTTIKGSCVTCHMSSFTCHMSNVTYHMSHVTCHMSHVKSSKIHHFQTVSARGLKFWDDVYHPIFVTWHMSNITCHMSHVKSSKYYHSQTVRARDLKFWAIGSLSSIISGKKRHVTKLLHLLCSLLTTQMCYFVLLPSHSILSYWAAL